MKTESLEPLINKGFAAHRILLKLYLYGKTGAKKHRYNVLAYLCTVFICCFAPPAAVFVLMAAPILMALALAVLVLGIVGLVKMAFG